MSFHYLPKEEKIKHFSDDRYIIFEGEYSKGIRWNGKGQEYDHLFRIIFQGEYINGKHFGNKYIYEEEENNYIFQNNPKNNSKLIILENYDINNENKKKEKNIIMITY